MTACRGCGNPASSRVLDLGRFPRRTTFPSLGTGEPGERPRTALRWTSAELCGLAQLADDDTVADEPRGVEPQALKDQAEIAIERVAAAGWLRGKTVREFGSPHGGSWIPLMTDRGFENTPLRRQTWCSIASASCTNRTNATRSRSARR